ncbi:hypothetical protein [Tunturiibacter gelidoferens]|uniref:Uncharacterized protein n=1 Tax=Tunturiibacter lichenicola TaxID=2051959 RepID=A0A7Y9NQZ1_9BACT|nr:hypothetical protein [Edaphobacter lichenicola]NYF53919.1 hypothetical protein [Edaphobacter lichenicola]
MLDNTAEINKNNLSARRHRNICQRTVSLYKRDMINGDWALNGEVISLDSAGAVMNGMHRLHACVAADVCFTTFLAKNVDCAAIDRFDTGLSRTFSDVLRGKGEKHSKLLAATVSYICRYESGTLQSPHRISNSELQRVLERHPGVRTHVAYVSGFYRRLRLSAFAAVSYIASLHNTTIASEFMKKVDTGSGLRRGDIHVVAMRDFLRPGSFRGRAAQYRRFVLVANAMNAEMLPEPPRSFGPKQRERFSGIAGVPYGQIIQTNLENYGPSPLTAFQP